MVGFMVNTDIQPTLGIAEDYFIILSIKMLLQEYRLTILDLLLLHDPFTYKTIENQNVRPKAIENSWRQMEQLVDAGYVRSLGLSNFSRDQIDRLIRFCNIKPVVLQMDSAILTFDRELMDYAHSFGIQVIVNDTNPNPTPLETAFLENEVVLKMAKNYLKNPHQILIRRAIQRDLIVLCCSTDPYRIRTSMSVFDFELSPDEMAKLDEVEDSVHRQCYRNNGRPT
nr:aldo keto reductase [Hymenolepis microstoma]